MISSELMNLFNFFHNQIGSKEWSGILFYTVKGSITDPDNMELHAETMMLKDVGTTASTGYEFDETVFDFLDANPEAEDMKMGMVHTHHNMTNYFSKTDMEELQDNAPNHNYYLSLIASYNCKYSAKLAFKVDQLDSKILVQDENGEPKELISPGSSYICVADCQIIFTLDSYNIAACKTLKEIKPKPTVPEKKNKDLYHGWDWVNGMWRRTSLPPKNDKKNPYTVGENLQKAISRLIFCDAEASSLEDIAPVLGFMRMNESLKIDEVNQYITEIEDILDLVVESIFGGATQEDINEFCEAALHYIAKLNIDEDNLFATRFNDMLLFNCDEEKLMENLTSI